MSSSSLETLSFFADFGNLENPGGFAQTIGVSEIPKGDEPSGTLHTDELSSGSRGDDSV